MSAILTIAAAAPASLSGMTFFVSNILPLLLIFGVFYFLLIRPQQRRAREHQEQILGVQKNDDVITSGGIMGKVIKVADEHVEVEIAQGVRVKVVKSTLSNVESRTKKPAND